MAKEPEKKQATKPIDATPQTGLAVAGGAFGLLATAVDQQAIQPLEDWGSLSNYLQFAHPNAKAYAKMIAANGGVAPNQGTPFLVSSGNYVKLDPFAFIYTPMYYQFYGTFDSNGDLEQARLPDGKRPPDDFDECIESIVYVAVTDQIIPARCRWKGPSCPALKRAYRDWLDQLHTKPEWQSRSEEHKVAVASGLPAFCWQTYHVTGTLKTPKDTSRGQKPYLLLESTPRVTSAIVLKNFRQMFNQQSFMDDTQKCIDAFNEQVKIVKQLVG